MSVLGGHVIIFTHSPANLSALDGFRVKSVQRGAPGQFVPFPCGSFRGKQNKYAVRSAPVKRIETMYTFIYLCTYFLLTYFD